MTDEKDEISSKRMYGMHREKFEKDWVLMSKLIRANEREKFKTLLLSDAAVEANANEWLRSRQGLSVIGRARRSLEAAIKQAEENGKQPTNKQKTEEKR